jgi:hypothetical protein
VAIIANTYQTYQAKGIREELSDVITNISPTETPFISNAGKGKVSNTFYEWQTDALASVDPTNKQIEGDDVAAFDAVAPTVRLGNYTQISRKTVVIAGTEEAVDKAGRESELSYQIAKKGKELKRDMEGILIGTNQAAAAGATGTARATGSLLAFVKSNTVKQTGGAPAGADPVYTNIPNAQRTDNSATVAFTETMLKTALSAAWTVGADVSTLMVGAGNKQVASGFAGIATKTYYQSAKTTAAIIGAADVYVSDFGTLSIVPNRFQRNRDAWLLDFDMIQVMYLRPFQQTPLAKTGDAEKRLMLVEFGLKVKTEAGLAGVFDLA